MLHCTFQMVPRGQVWRSVMLKGKPVYLSYGGRETRRIAQEHGTQVLKQPDICFLMREQELGLLHVGLSWTIGAACPFLGRCRGRPLWLWRRPEVSWPGHDNSSWISSYRWLAGVSKASGTHHGSGLRSIYEYPNTTNFWIRSMSLDCMLVMTSFTLARNMPVVITLTAEQSTCRLYWLVWRMNGAVAAHTSQLDRTKTITN